jgi:hypothetical protein
MMDLDHENQMLVVADRDIEDARQRILRQEEIIRELKRDGHDTAKARELLVTFKGTLDVMIEHRGLILARINALERGAG